MQVRILDTGKAVCSASDSSVSLSGAPDLREEMDTVEETPGCDPESQGGVGDRTQSDQSEESIVEWGAGGTKDSNSNKGTWWLSTLKEYQHLVNITILQSTHYHEPKHQVSTSSSSRSAAGTSMSKDIVSAKTVSQSQRSCSGLLQLPFLLPKHTAQAALHDVVQKIFDIYPSIGGSNGSIVLSPLETVYPSYTLEREAATKLIEDSDMQRIHQIKNQATVLKARISSPAVHLLTVTMRYLQPESICHYSTKTKCQQP